MRIRISILLITAIGGLTAIAVGSVLLVTATASVKNTLELVQSRANLTMLTVERGIIEHVSPVQNLIHHFRHMVSDGEIDIDDDAQLIAALKGSLAAEDQVAGVAVWRLDGSGIVVLRTGPGELLVEAQDTRNNPQLAAYLLEARDLRAFEWGVPFHRDGRSFLAVSGALTKDEKRVGTMAAGISVTELSQYVGGDVTRSDMTAFVLYGDNQVLAHPALLEEQNRDRVSPEQPLLPVEEINDRVLASFDELPIAELPEGARFELREAEVGDETYIILSRVSNAFGAVPWQIGIHVPADAVNQELKRLAGSIAVGVGLLVLAILAAVLLARRIARPIRAVSTAAAQIADLKLDAVGTLPGSHIRELDEQAKAFNRMVHGLRWFNTYVPRQLVNRLMEAGDGSPTAAREAELTVMFTDIIGFTRLSEDMPPAAVAEMLNHHFELLNNCIDAEDGTLDKFIGDATMAFWGAPEPIPDHAERACRAALAISEAVAKEHASGERAHIRVKIALHTGPLIVGNIGAQARMNYTIIGDTVNVCSRIESLGSTFDDGAPVVILVSGDLMRAAGPGFVFEHLGEREVKGRAQPVEVWRLVGFAAPGA